MQINQRKVPTSNSVPNTKAQKTKSVRVHQQKRSKFFIYKMMRHIPVVQLQ